MLESMQTFCQQYKKNTKRPQAHTDHGRTKLNWQHFVNSADFFVVINEARPHAGLIKVENTDIEPHSGCSTTNTTQLYSVYIYP